MRIKREGFSLIEVLAIIVVMTIFSLIVIPSVFNTIKNARQQSYDTLVSDIEENGRVYASQHREDVENSFLSLNYYTITLSDLKREGLLKTPVIDPRTDEVISLTKKLIVTLAEDNTLSICFEDRGCFIPTLLYNKLAANIASGEIQGLHQDITNNYYYYKGSNPNNWFLFNDYLWRIVKINDDGTIKIVFEGKKKNNGTIENGNIGSNIYHSSASNDYNASLSIKTTLQNWYDENITEDNKKIVRSTKFCIGKTLYNAGGVSKTTFINNECSSQTTSSLAVGLLTAGEYLSASLDSNCSTSANIVCGNKNYLNKSDYEYWSITGDSGSNDVWSVINGAKTSSPTVEKGIRPVINLIEGALISEGDGSFDNPYKVKKVVNIDQTKPVITILGDNPIEVGKNSIYVDAGATAFDDADGDLTARIQTISNVNTSVIGTYTVNYVVIDNAGNMSLPKVRIVKVIKTDLTPPVITLLGNNPAIVPLGSEYIDAGATALDDVDGNITSEIQVSSNVNTEEEGFYTVTYTVTDSSDNEATPVTRTVNVKVPNYTFDYTGEVQSAYLPIGTYKIEVWGAQGGYYNENNFGGYGAYSVGVYEAASETTLYVAVGGQAKSFNGGGNGGGYVTHIGGGATHIATRTGQLSTLSSYLSSILIVAGGGGGGGKYIQEGYGVWTGRGGDGGGIQGNQPSNPSYCPYYCSSGGSGGTQSAGGSGGGGSYGIGGAGTFGQGGAGIAYAGWADTGGGGGGYYGGGGAGGGSAGGGGSGYIGGVLTNATYGITKAMYCYSCSTSSADNTRTYSTTNVSSIPTANYAKIGNGYAKITYLGP